MRPTRYQLRYRRCCILPHPIHSGFREYGWLVIRDFKWIVAHFVFWCPLVAPYRHDPCRVWLVSIRFHHRPSVIVVDAFSARSPAEAGSGVSLAVQPSEVQESNAIVRPICIGLHRVHSSVVRAADCRSAGPWFKSGCALCRVPCNADMITAQSLLSPSSLCGHM